MSGLAALWVRAAIAALWLMLVGAIAWGLHRQPGREPELIRKTVHIGTGNVILLAWWLDLPTWMGVGASIVFSFVTLLSYFVPILPGINSVGRKSLGTYFYAVSIGLLVAWFWPRSLPQFAVLGILTMTWGDGLAGLIGKYWGRHRYQLGGLEKSWEGSLTMAGVSFAIALPLLLMAVAQQMPLTGATVAVTGLMAAGVAIAAAGLEAFSWLGIDNLTVPLGSAFLAWGLSGGLTLLHQPF